MNNNYYVNSSNISSIIVTSCHNITKYHRISLTWQSSMYFYNRKLPFYNPKMSKLMKLIIYQNYKRTRFERNFSYEVILIHIWNWLALTSLSRILKVFSVHNRVEGCNCETFEILSQTCPDRKVWMFWISNGIFWNITPSIFLGNLLKVRK